MNPLDALAPAWIACYVIAQLLLVVYSSHRYVILWRWWRARRRPERPPVTARTPAAWPIVTVQLPVFNERRVVERLIDAVAAFDYPADRLEIQVLDDSTDDTRAIAARAVARHRARGLDIHHLIRDRREGYKAGALSAGLARARGDLLAVFDADFVPHPDFLRRAVAHFSDPGVGMVQGRWEHLNRDRSALTAAQGVMLDAHFLLEHAARMGSGLFFNFNGTAGVWRRACIAESGGWTHDTLTEDLDLSYRAQLAGWRFVFDPTLEAPAELPADIEALKSQQRRWARGSIQTARKVLPTLLRRPLPWRVRLEAWFHLTSNVAYPLLLVIALLQLPVLLGPPTAPAWLVTAVHLGVLAFGVVPVGLFLAVGRRASGAGWLTLLREVPAALALGVGLSVNNGRAVVAGLSPRLGDWERTPKTGERGARGGSSAYRSTRGRTGRTELVLALYFTALAVFALQAGHDRALPFMVLLAVGFGYVGGASWSASRRALAPDTARLAG